MTDLSPAAQALMDVVNALYEKDIPHDKDIPHHIVAAALRAAADQAVPESCFESDDAIRVALLAIADELEGNA
jgi:hypothetical protein